MARAPDFELAAALAKPGFTPAQRDAPALVALIAGGDDKVVARASAALAGLRDAGRAAIERAFDAADEGARARLVGVLGQLARAGDGDARARVLAAIGADGVRVRRAAAIALGKLGGDDARAALLARWDAGDAPPDERRALVEALGKLGGAEALARIQGVTTGDDTELARRRDRALLMADRSAHRDAVSEIAVDVAPPAAVTVRLGCRPGLATLLAEELAALGRAPRVLDDAHVAITLAEPLAALFASRLWATLALELPITLPRVARGARADRVAEPEALAAALVRAIASPATRALLGAWTRGPIRWRLGFATGHKRAIVWRVARDVTAAAPELVNDPTATTWDFRVDEAAGRLELIPRRLVDPRFAWRVADVPAASHPTVAAALAWVARARPDDRVWDPFCGSGVELVERARRGPAAALAGSDVDPAALEAARANLAAAGVVASLTRADARTHPAGPVDVILTNPPLGSRVQLDAAALLTDALPHLARQLAPGGRLVWITPASRRTSPVAERLGLHRAYTQAIDLGGVRGHLERWDRAPRGD